MSRIDFCRKHLVRVTYSTGEVRYHTNEQAARYGMDRTVWIAEVRIWNEEAQAYLPVDDTAAIGGRR